MSKGERQVPRSWRTPCPGRRGRSWRWCGSCPTPWWSGGAAPAPRDASACPWPSGSGAGTHLQTTATEGVVYCLLKAFKPRPTAQGHLRAFHKFKSYTCCHTKKALNIQKTIHKNKQKCICFKSKNSTFGITLVFASNKAGTCHCIYSTF